MIVSIRIDAMHLVELSVHLLFPALRRAERRWLCPPFPEISIMDSLFVLFDGELSVENKTYLVASVEPLRGLHVLAHRIDVSCDVHILVRREYLRVSVYSYVY